MSPAILGTLFLVFMAVVVYWLLSAVRRPVDTYHWRTLRELSYGFDFETAPEIMAYPTEMIDKDKIENNIQLIRVQDSWLACWNMQEELLGVKKEEAKIKDGDNEIVLRIYESSDFLRYYDIRIERLRGCCKLYLQPYKAYYVSLGFKKRKKYHPVLVSNTVIPNNLQ